MSYVYEARCKRVRDGDTPVMVARAEIRWPDETVVAEREFVVRLLEVDCPERRRETKAAGDAAKAFTESRLFRQGLDAAVPPEPVPAELALTGQKDVYGRWLGWVGIEGEDLSRMLVDSGHGVEVEYAAHVAMLVAEEGP